MTATRRRPAVFSVLLAAIVGACAIAPAAPSTTGPTVTVGPSAPATTAPSASQPPPSPVPSPSGPAISRGFMVAGANVFLECKGTGSPTVIVETGLGGDSGPWAGVIDELASSTRACRYDRPGIGRSEARPGAAPLSGGDRADGLHDLLDAADVEGPYVMVGFSYGGMLIRAFTARYPTEVDGLVFVDGSHEDQFMPGGWWMDWQAVWDDGRHRVDMARTRDELLQAGDLGARPTIVLTQGEMTGELERRWTTLQDAVAAKSSNSLHMVATAAGHDIRADRPELVVEAIRAVVDSARGEALATCGPRFETLGAECLAGTMTDLLAAWDARRSAVVPAAGRLPRGSYGFEEDGAAIVFDIGRGRLETTISHPDGTVESFTAAYAAVGDEVTILWPFDRRMPRTPGVNTATWTVDTDGAIHFDQIDGELPEPWLAVPWLPTPGA